MKGKLRKIKTKESEDSGKILSKEHYVLRNKITGEYLDYIESYYWTITEKQSKARQALVKTCKSILSTRYFSSTEEFEEFLSEQTSSIDIGAENPGYGSTVKYPYVTKGGTRYIGTAEYKTLVVDHILKEFELCCYVAEFHPKSKTDMTFFVNSIK